MTSIQTAKHAFEERFYRWSLADWQREITQDYPLLRSPKLAGARYAVAIMESLRTERRWRMAQALAKRSQQKDTLSRCSDDFTEEDKRLEQFFFDAMQNARTLEALNRPIIALNPTAYLKKLNRRGFRKIITQFLSPVLGQAYEDWGSGEWRYRTMVGPWHVVTYIDTGGRYHELNYDHCIIFSDTLRLYEGASLLHWLGIMSQTMWEDLDDSEAESAAGSLARIIAHFMDAVPKLLEGLSPDP